MKIALREETYTDVEDAERKRCAIYCIGLMDGLIDKGLIDGPKLLTKSGKRIYNKLIKEKYDPPQDLFLSTVTSLMDTDLSKIGE